MNSIEMLREQPALVREVAPPNSARHLTSAASVPPNSARHLPSAASVPGSRPGIAACSHDLSAVIFSLPSTFLFEGFLASAFGFLFWSARVRQNKAQSIALHIQNILKSSP